METALNINWLLKHKFHKYFDKYIDLDYGIGIEYSDAYIIRAGLTNSQNNNDLVYISPAVNLAVAISNQLAGDNNIGITEDVSVIWMMIYYMMRRMMMQKFGMTPNI